MGPGHFLAGVENMSEIAINSQEPGFPASWTNTFITHLIYVLRRHLTVRGSSSNLPWYFS